MKRKKSTFLGVNLEDRNTVAAIRIFGYGLMLAAAAVIAALLVATANGYDINRETGEVIQNGLILVDSEPVEADIFVDGQDEDDRTPGRLPLPAGLHTVSLQREGYNEWTKQLELGGSEVEWLYYPRLFPTQMPATLLQNYDTFHNAVQSVDRRWVLLQQDNTIPEFTLIDTENILDAAQTITIPASQINQAAANADAVESFEIIEWSGSNRHVLIEHIAAGESQFIVIDRTSAANAINVTELVDLDISDVYFRGNRGDIVYANVEDSVREIKLDDGEVSAPLLREVVQYIPNGDDRLLFVRATDDESFYETGIYNDGEIFVVSQVTASERDYFLLLDTYDDDEYFSIGSTTSDTVEVYRNVESKSSAALQPFTTIKSATTVDSVTMSTNKQFILVQADNRFATYDLEEVQRTGFNIEETLDGTSEIQWIDSHRFITTDTKNNLISYEFDGTNRVSLGMTALPGITPLFDRNIENLYLFDAAASGEKFVLSQTSLLLDN